MGKLRLPASFLYLIGGCFLMAAIISAGVAVSQGPNADWLVSKWASAGFAACVAFWATGLIDWIPDEELKAMDRRDAVAELEQELKDGTFARKSASRSRWWWVALLALFIGEPLFRRGMRANTPLPNGGDGMTVFGLTLGTYAPFGRTWTGVELLILGGGAAAIAYYLKIGFTRLGRAQK